MTETARHVFTGHEAALAYALSAERIAGGDVGFLNANPAVIPIFVSQLFQSLEIGLKYAGIASGLFTVAEARSKAMRRGHGIKELAVLAVEKLGGDPFLPILMAMTHFSRHRLSRQIIKSMICGDEFETTRVSYASRRLGYAQIADGEFRLVTDIPGWIAVVKETAANLPRTVEILAGWKASPSKSKHFAIFVR